MSTKSGAISKDVQFNADVTAAQFDQSTNKWTVTTNTAGTFTCQYLVFATGFAAKTFVPDIKGLDTFKGSAFHTAVWPKEKGTIDFQGKRVGVVGTGASGVQVIQELAPIVKHLTVFQRTPNMALPMRQKQLDVSEQDERKKTAYNDLFALRRQTLAGWDYSPIPIKTFDASPEERVALWERLWDKGGFHLWLGNYCDLIQSQGANDLTYNFWREKVLQRISNSELAEHLAPQVPPHPFGTKRPSLEQRYWEVYNQSNVDLVNLKQTPIKEVTATSVVTAKVAQDDKEHPLDILILATGFDAGIGALNRINIKGTIDQTLKEKWSEGTVTQFGISVAGFPNMLMLYGPQSPCAFATGPTTAEIQGEWIIDLLDYARQNHHSRIEVLPEAEIRWAQHSNDLANGTLLPLANSWYMGANIAGKKRESMNYIGGLPAYSKALTDCRDNKYEGWKLS